ncbi:hypothetical protein FE257_010466 [Aspergillus nanangensis]|uniref:Quinate repressor protein n=1 Tax=Aspergillus nanangensis TaxID=2582783 RepID=A0AAD4CJ42_ASPNN|nr:hypothetical protein FE257_010466 [Aspergillus nanangensis]
MEASSSSPDSKPPSRKYIGDESIVLVGFVGAGKKTLAVIAAMALQRMFVDFDAYFRRQYHTSPHDYIADHGLKQFRDVEAGVSERLLSRHKTGCVISGLGMGNTQQRILLQQFSQHSPVIYIKREREVIQRELNLTEDKFVRLYQLGHAYFESCSNFEFYNITQAGPATPALQNGAKDSTPDNLRLKDTESAFMGFLRHIFGSPLLKSIYSADPLSPSYTYALQVPLKWLEHPTPNYEELNSGADCVSLLVDLPTEEPIHDMGDRVSRQLSVLRRHTRTPIMLDIRLPSNAALSRYQELLVLGLRLAVDIICMSLDCPDWAIERLVAQKGSSIIVGTHTLAPGLHWDYQSVRRYTKRANALGLDAVRFCQSPECPTDSGSATLDHLAFLREARRSSPLPVIAYKEGVRGKPSIFFNSTLSAVALPSMNNCGATLDEAIRAIYSCSLLPARKFTIFGSSVFYSLSPAMHNAAYKAYSLPHTYSVLQSDRFDDVRTLLQDSDHGGVAISLPYKTRVLPFLGYISPDAQDIQAVNTVVMSRECDTTNCDQHKTILKGYNTDYIGIRECIDRHLSPANIIRPGSTALILGAGGMARAAVYACHKLGVADIVISNRTVANAQLLADYYQSWAESHNPRRLLRVHVQQSLDTPWPTNLQQPTIIVSCIPAHGVGEDPPPRLKFPEAWLQSKTGGVFIELAYKPRETLLMMQMQEKISQGWVIVDGLHVLVEQGLAQFELFTHRPAPVHAMKRALRLQQSLRV